LNGYFSVKNVLHDKRCGAPNHGYGTQEAEASGKLLKGLAGF
jgi:hypothetical protein